MTFEVILIAILMFFLLVGIHEWGHFYTAKKVGILTREFAIGFGPKLFSWIRGETRYTFRLLPMGGYVRMAGEDPELVQVNPGQLIAIRERDGKVTHLFLDKLDERTDVTVGTVESIDMERAMQLRLDIDGEQHTFEIDRQAMMVARGRETQIAPWDRQFGSKSVGQRALVIFAGPFMNFVLAFVLFFTFVMANGVVVEDANYIVIGNVMDDTPAEAAGLKRHDIVHAVNGETIAEDSEKLIRLISESADTEMNWVVIRDGETISITVTPERLDGVGRVGISVHPPTRTPGLIEAIEHTGRTMYDSTVQILDAIRMLVTLQLSMDDLGGPVRITEATGEAYSLGVTMLIFWVALLSLYLGIFNLLPFPALDGSRLLFFLVEAIRGKPVDPQRESLVHFIGFAMLMVLMIAVTYNDILRLFKG